MRSGRPGRWWLCRVVLLGLALVTGARSVAWSGVGEQGGREAAGRKGAGKGPFRKLAPGVERTIDPAVEVEETFSRHDLVEVLAVDPEFGERSFSQGRSPAKDVAFQRDIWALEFTFKPVRFVEVDVPDPLGRMQRKVIWYMVYHVKNTGREMQRSVAEDGAVQVGSVEVGKPVRFVPRFVLQSWDTKKSYPDRLIPVAIPVIQKREDPNRRLFSTAEITGEIPPSKADQDRSVWGVVTWEDIDPATDHFSIYIQGLTNAYRWQDARAGEPSAYVYKKGDKIGTGRKLLYKTLRLNFWRPSDRFYEHEEEIRFGYFPHPSDERFGLAEEEKIDYQWIYR